jgi:hypothetical protein
VEKESENLEVILTADGRRWTQINTDGFFSLDDLSREIPEALRANMSNCFDRGANDNFLFVCGSQRESAVEKKSENLEVMSYMLSVMIRLKRATSYKI